MKEGDIVEALPRSGNPGYTPGLPIIGAVEEKANLKTSKLMLLDAGKLPIDDNYGCTFQVWIIYA